MRFDDGEVHVWKVRLPEGPGWTLGDASALALRRIVGPGPHVRAPRARTVDFEHSHARDVMLVALSRSLRAAGSAGGRVRETDHGLISRSWFSPAEQREVEGLPHSRRRRAFFHAWARKEAYIKAIGLRVSIALEESRSGSARAAGRC
jgi:phosphopantetheinyl transferase